jgi:hypothetical protein
MDTITNQEFHKWLFAGEAERKKVNPFTRIIAIKAKSWPKVQQPKFN